MKRIISFISAILICAALAVPAFAVSSTYVYDYSGVSLSEDKIDELNKAARSISEKYNADFFYILTDDISPCATTSLYAESAYEKFASDGKEGACFTYFIRDNKMYLYCTDGMKSVLTEDVQNQLYDIFNNNDTYNDAAELFYKYLTEFFEKNGPLSVNSTDSEQATEKKEIPEERQLPYVLDNAGVLKAQEKAALNKKLKDYSEQCKCDISIVIVPSTDGKDVELYTVDFYDFNGYGYGDGDDGLLLLLSMENRDWCVSRHGKAEAVFTQDVTDEMISNVSGYLSNNDFYNAFDKFADDFHYRYQNGGKSRVSLIWIPIDIVIGFVIAYVVMKIRTAGLTSVMSKRNAADYVVDGSLALASSSDSFLFMNVTRTPKPKQNTNSGGGGSITGSSGRTHSVSSGKF